MCGLCLGYCNNLPGGDSYIKSRSLMDRHFDYVYGCNTAYWTVLCYGFRLVLCVIQFQNAGMIIKLSDKELNGPRLRRYVSPDDTSSDFESIYTTIYSTLWLCPATQSSSNPISLPQTNIFGQ